MYIPIDFNMLSGLCSIVGLVVSIISLIITLIISHNVIKIMSINKNTNKSINKNINKLEMKSQSPILDTKKESSDLEPTKGYKEHSKNG